MKYKKIQPEDAPFLKRIFDFEEYDLYFAEKGAPLSKWECLIRDYYLDSHSYIICTENQSVGWLMYSQGGAICDVDILVFLPEERGKGYGRQVFNDLLKRHPQIRLIRLDVQQRNTRAMEFYKKYGFVKMAEEYQRVGDDKVLYHKLQFRTQV